MTISDPNGARKCAGLRQGSGALLPCPQHELQPNPPTRAPSQFLSPPTVLLVRQQLAGERTLDWSQAWVLVLSLLLSAGWFWSSWSCHFLILLRVGFLLYPFMG